MSFLQRRTQSGVSLVEFSIVAIPILLLGLGGIEIAQWFFHKQAISLALVEAGRSAIVDHAHPLTIESAFEDAMLPLFVSSTKPLSRRRLHLALAERRAKTSAAPWRIEILSPSPAAFQDFSTPALEIAQQTGLPAISNAYLAEQDAGKHAQGWARGAGPQSGQTIWDANTLVLRLTWLHEPLLPLTKGLIRLLGDHHGSYGRQAMARGGYLPLTQEVALVMQSHPVYWPLPGSGKVIRTATTKIPSPEPPTLTQTPTPTQIPSPPATSQPVEVPPQHPPPPQTFLPLETAAALGAPTQADGTWPTSNLVVAPDDPACGVVLCCG